MNAFIEKHRGGRAERKEATHARILEVARAHLLAHGFEATNIREVARAAGVATGTVLLHFDDKRDLLHAALFEDLAAAWATAAAAARGAGSLRKKLQAIAETFFGYYAERPALSRALLRESLFAESPWRERFAAQVAEVHGFVVVLTEEARSRGELAPKVDAQVMGASFFSFYYFSLLAWLQGGHPAPARLFERMLTQHLAGYEKTKRPPKKGSKRP